MVLYSSSVLYLLSALVASTVAFQAPNITLPYVNLTGSYSSRYNITYYRRIPFGASTAGPNRFRAPQPPPNISHVYDTDQSFPSCPLQDGTGSEDCLYLGIYSRPWSSPAAGGIGKTAHDSRPRLRPVTVVFHGGAYIAGTASFDIPPYGYPTLNASSSSSDGNDFVLVYPNYRLGALGFLPGRAIKDAAADDDDAVLNPGLLDQRAALAWVRDNIERFGGDPRDVSIAGQSAGGGSVVAQAIASDGGGGVPLFRRALVSSPFWLRTYAYDDPEAEALYENFVRLTGCPSQVPGTDNSTTTLDCLRGLDLGAIVKASTAVARLYMSPHYVWAPVIDGSFLTGTLTEALAGGNNNNNKRLGAEVVWGMFNSNEGASFVDSSLQGASGTPYNATEAGFDGWLADFLPRFSRERLQAVKSVYPAAGTTDSASWAWNTTFGRAAYIYRDTVLACPAYWVASAAPKTAWLGEYAVSPARHVSDSLA